MAGFFNMLSKNKKEAPEKAKVEPMETIELPDGFGEKIDIEEKSGIVLGYYDVKKTILTVAFPTEDDGYQLRGFKVLDK